MMKKEIHLVIAITDVNLGGGTLYYSLDNGTSWSDVGTVSETSARRALCGW